MKKTLFAYELVSKQTGDGGAAGITYFVSTFQAYI